jgi:transcriptional regulator with XRE-family HTH domain
MKENVILHDLNPHEIGQRLEALRKDNELSTWQLGKKLTVCHTSISVWERGDRIPSTQVIAKYSQFFGVTTDYILFGIRNTEAEA